MLRKLVYFLSKWQGQLTILSLQILFSIFGLYNYFFNFNLSKDFLIKQSQETQLTVTRAGTKSVEVFMKSIINQLLILERNNVIDSLDKEKTRQAFQQFVDNTDELVADIARYDKEGKLVVIENKRRIYTGEKEDYSDRDFIQWSKTQAEENQILITPPYIARAGAARGKAIIVVATPSYFNHEYTGTIAIRFALNEFKKSFIDPLGTADEETMIIDSSGRILVGRSSLGNQNLLDYAKKTKWNGSKDFIDKFKQMLNSYEGRDIWKFQYPGENPKSFLATYNKINIPNTDNDLYLIVTRNEPNITSSINPFYAYGTYWLGGGILLSVLIGFGIILVKKFEHFKEE